MFTFCAKILQSTQAFRLSFILLFSGLIFGCSSLPRSTAQVPTDWQETLQQREQILSWKIQGKLGVQTSDNGGSLDLFWNQQGDNYQIRMVAPMGQGAVLIRGDARGIYVKTADGSEQYSEDAGALVASELGVDIPLAGLRSWVRGLPDKGQPVSEQRWDAKGRLVKLVQNNWNIEMSSYSKVAEHMLPSRFHFGRDDRPEMSVRLLIRQWGLVE